MFSQADPRADGSGEERSFGIVRKTPWWAISGGLHTAAFLAIGFFWTVQAQPEEEAVVVSPPRKPRPLPEMEKRRDLDPNRKILDVKKPSEDPVFKKKAEEAERNETEDQEEFKQPKGDSRDLVTDKPFKSKGAYDVVGGGGGGGGRYGSRLGGKEEAVKRGGGDPFSQGAVTDALRWLARHQNADGSWSATGYVRQCRQGSCLPNPGHEDFDAGVTGLSLLAFLGAGYSHLSKDTYDGICFGDVVRKGLQWMMSHQDPEGCIGSRNAQKYMYNHTICALAMSEAYGLTGSNLF
ncbi:MAG TPA: hypothetical protein VNO22_04275, partial [Planctomycetota bacterium]|nr:hypothetical protein [Planctomycetota bacterium]